MKRLSLVMSVLLGLSTVAQGTKITPTPLPALVAKADFIVVGIIAKMDIIDSEGNELNDPEARTGPGSGNTIRFHVITDRGAIIKGNGNNLPQTFIVPKWRKWHTTLKDSKIGVEGEKFIFLLGKDYAPVSAPESIRPLSERKSIEKLINPKKWFKRQATGSSDGMRN